MKNPKNNPNKWLRPDKPPSAEEIEQAIGLLIAREVKAIRQGQLNKAIADYEWATGR